MFTEKQKLSSPLLTDFETLLKVFESNEPQTTNMKKTQDCVVNIKEKWKIEIDCAGKSHKYIKTDGFQAKQAKNEYLWKIFPLGSSQTET